MNAQHTPRPQWFKSSYSTAQGGDCIETAAMNAGAVGVRDSKDVDRGHLTVSAASWRALTSSIKH
ncbi:hypothetical protein GCM10023205_40550 [Yinghuangia aomiensis]|uniref:DUF397 domain-containing protein n=1 Tax=Yinghuangia aomiensis TaxID=676205 RepID=A0ABP9HHD1_9ACTN